MGLHDNFVQSLIRRQAGFEGRGQEAADQEYGNLKRDFPYLGGEDARPIAVTMAEQLPGNAAIE